MLCIKLSVSRKERCLIPGDSHGLLGHTHKHSVQTTDGVPARVRVARGCFRAHDPPLPAPPLLPGLLPTLCLHAQLFFSSSPFGGDEALWKCLVKAKCHFSQTRKELPPPTGWTQIFGGTDGGWSQNWELTSEPSFLFPYKEQRQMGRGTLSLRRCGVIQAT